MFHKFKIIQMLTELPRLCTAATPLANFLWHKSFYARRSGLEIAIRLLDCPIWHNRETANAALNVVNKSRIN